MDTPDTQAGNTPKPEPAKRFIRTLASDMEALQAGGKPELAPFEEGATPTVPTPEAPKAPEVKPTPPPLPAPKAPQPVTPPPAPKPQTPALAPEPEKEEAMPTPIKTYSQDFRERMKQTKASTATVLAAEQNARTGAPAPQPTEEPHKKRNIIYASIGGVLLLLGITGFVIAYTQYSKSKAPVLIEPLIETRIFVDERANVSGTGESLMQALVQSAASPVTNGKVRLLSLEGGEASSVFSALALPVPGILSRNIVQGSASMAGIVSANAEQYPFFILGVTAFGDTFAGMLQWEPTMAADLARLYPPYPVTTPVSGAATSTPVATTTPAVTPGFTDASVENHDVRVYQDARGRDLIIYGYWDEHTLVIAHDRDAFKELINRLATSRTNQ